MRSTRMKEIKAELKGLDKLIKEMKDTLEPFNVAAENARVLYERALKEFANKKHEQSVQWERTLRKRSELQNELEILKENESAGEVIDEDDCLQDLRNGSGPSIIDHSNPVISSAYRRYQEEIQNIRAYGLQVVMARRIGNMTAVEPDFMKLWPKEKVKAILETVAGFRY